MSVFTSVGSTVAILALTLDARTVHLFVPVFDHLLKLTTFHVFGIGADFEKFVPVEARNPVADREVRQCLRTIGHDILQANHDVSDGAGENMEHDFLKWLAFRDSRVGCVWAGVVIRSEAVLPCSVGPLTPPPGRAVVWCAPSFSWLAGGAEPPPHLPLKTT